MAARLHRKMLHGLCSEGVLMIVTIMRRLLKNAKMPDRMLTATTRASLMRASESSCIGTPTQPGMPQLMVPFAVILFCETSLKGFKGFPYYIFNILEQFLRMSLKIEIYLISMTNAPGK